MGCAESSRVICGDSAQGKARTGAVMAKDLKPLNKAQQVFIFSTLKEVCSTFFDCMSDRILLSFQENRIHLY